MSSIRILSGSGFCHPIRMALTALILAGCTPPQITVDRLAAGADGRSCPAQSLQGTLGHPFTVLAPVPLPDGLRVLRPGQTVTRDLQPARLNAQVDDTGRILRLFCG